MEGRHMRLNRREIGLVLDVDALDGDLPATRGALRRRQHLDDLIDVLGHGPPRPAPVGRSGLAARTPRARMRSALREGRRLPLGCAARCLKLLLEPIALFAQPVPFALDLLPLALRPLKLTPQSFDLLPQPLVLAVALLPRRRPPLPRHCHATATAARKHISFPGSTTRRVALR
jgi:hypothetical protein